MEYNFPVLIILIIAYLIKSTFGRAAHICREPNLHIDSCSETHESINLILGHQHRRTNDITAFTHIQYEDIQTPNKQCTWQVTGNYNSTCPHHFVMNR